MKRSSFSRRMRRDAALVLLAGAAMASGTAAPARADEDGQGSVLGSVMQMIGLRDKPAVAPAKINYRDRGPLVMPKSMDLPAPVPGAEARNAAWPKDPDVAATRRAEAEARAPAQQLDQEKLMAFRDMAKDRSTAPAGRASDCSDAECDPHQIWAQLRIKKGDPGGMQESAAFVPGKEPVRAYLTEPPAGYLKPTQAVKPAWEPKRDKDAEQNPAVYLLHQKGEKAGTDYTAANN
jgi:hypothetical protein